MKPTYFKILPVTITLERYFVGGQLRDDSHRKNRDQIQTNDASRNMCHDETYAIVSTEFYNEPASTVTILPDKSYSCNHFSNQPSTSRHNHAEHCSESYQSSCTLRKKDLLTESYADNRAFSILHERIDDSSQGAAHRTKFHSNELHKQTYMDELLLKKYGFSNCFVKAKLSANVNKIWDKHANLNFVENTGKKNLRLSQCLHLRAFRAYPKYRYSKFGF
ncbi:hypothetical protein Ddc_17212 [Ditylenchus destructor]|nr:hypothetical protein Ddc_17212 [Ditylenchus destructor]